MGILLVTQSPRSHPIIDLEPSQLCLDQVQSCPAWVGIPLHPASLTSWLLPSLPNEAIDPQAVRAKGLQDVRGYTAPRGWGWTLMIAGYVLQALSAYGLSVDRHIWK